MTLLWLTLAVFLALGVSCVAIPAEVRDLEMRLLKKSRIARINPFNSWMETDGFVSYLRAMGIVLVVFVSFIVYLISTHELVVVK
jgi:hypothetical protein